MLFIYSEGYTGFNARLELNIFLSGLNSIIRIDLKAVPLKKQTCQCVEQSQTLYNLCYLF